MHLYITTPTDRIGFSEGRLTVVTEGGKESDYPIEILESLSLFGQPMISTHLIKGLLQRDIDLLFYTTDGHFYGRLHNPEKSSAARQKIQALMSLNEDFRLAFAKSVISAKIANQIGLLKAYDKDGAATVSDVKNLEHSLRWVDGAAAVDEVMGFEGNAAKAYFAALGKLVPEEFAFSGRSKRPPKDAFNAIISFGYSMLHKNMVGAIERHGLNAYFGFMHADKEGHPALASDLIEEWRAIIVDDTALHVLRDKQLLPEQFEHKAGGAVYAGREGMRILAKAFGEKICRAQSYRDGDPLRYGFQYAIDLQVNSLMQAIEVRDSSLYKPVRVYQQ